MNTNAVLHFCALVMLAAAGCAQHSAYVVARGNPQHPVTRSDRIAVTVPGNTRSRMDEVYRALLIELEADGFKVVSPAEADYQLVALLDKNAHSGYVTPPRSNQEVIPVGMIGGHQYYQTTLYTPPEPQVKVYRESEGIRLSVFPTRVQQPAQLQAAWDGYADTGRNRVTRSQHHTLLKTLLSYFGQDYVGQAKLAD